MQARRLYHGYYDASVVDLRSDFFEFKYAVVLVCVCLSELQVFGTCVKIMKEVCECQEEILLSIEIVKNLR
jgi:hypothetical protein